MAPVDVSRLVDDRPADGVFRVHRDVYADPALFALEQQHVFERTWSYLCHESQVARPFDYRATHIGRVPVLVTRNAQGGVGAFLNACRHKGALLTRAEHGQRRYHVCPYHGWAYDCDGRNVGVKDEQAGCYADAFAAENHDLLPLARVASYKGFVFGSLHADVPDLAAFLGELRFFIDLAADQGDQGMEVVPGRVAFIYDGNWKLQLDNGSDFYHLTSTHSGFMDVMARRRSGAEGHQAARQFDWQKRLSQAGGTYQFEHGHAAVWLNQAEVEKRPIYPRIDEIRSRVGAARAEWMLKIRLLTVFPSMQIADGTSLNIRTFRPLGVGRTEMRYYCLAPIGEDPDARAWRLRQFEDFFNVSGLATPDDAVLYEDLQRGFAAHPMAWLQGYARGMGAVERGPNDTARTMGFLPAASVQGPFEMQNETSLHAVYREWARLMQAGIDGAPPYA